MDFVVTYCCDDRVEVRYLISGFLGHARHTDLLSMFSEKTDKLDPNKLLHVGMDGPNVNWNFYDILVRKREENELAGLMNIGSCGLHVLHGAFKTGDKNDALDNFKNNDGTFL